MMRIARALSLCFLLATILAIPVTPARAAAAAPAPSPATVAAQPALPAPLLAPTPPLAPLAGSQPAASTCPAPTPATAATGAADALAAQPAGCPLYRACMQFVGGGCSCAGFVCDGRFICGTPIT